MLGGTGFIGSHVVRRLQEARAEVTTVQRGPGGLTADRTDLHALRAALAEAAPAVLVDMIGYTAEDVERLLPSLPATLERLVVISSGDVYWTYGAFLGHEPAGPTPSPLDESAPLRKSRYPYRAMAPGPEDMRYRYEKIDVEEIARGAAGGTYNLGESDALSEGEWLETVAAVAGVACKVIPDPEVAPSMPVNWEIPLVTDTRLIRTQLGYREPVGRPEGVRRSLATE